MDLGRWKPSDVQFMELFELEGIVLAGLRAA
jgi:hypothetical protein